MSGKSCFRLAEEPLGPLALERLDRAELMAEFDRACERPVPDYPALALEKLFPERRPWTR